MNLEPIVEEELNNLTKGSAYKDLVIWNGNLWNLCLNEDQRYLGRSYVWLTSRHVDFHQLDDLKDAERQELQVIMRSFRHAVSRLWGADMVNCSWLGNRYESHRGHGHMHLVPRYRRAPHFEDREFPDDRFGSDYKPYERLVLPKEELASLVVDLKNAFLNHID